MVELGVPMGMGRGGAMLAARRCMVASSTEAATVAARVMSELGDESSAAGRGVSLHLTVSTLLHARASTLYADRRWSILGVSLSLSMA